MLKTITNDTAEKIVSMHDLRVSGMKRNDLCPARLQREVIRTKVLASLLAIKLISFSILTYLPIGSTVDAKLPNVSVSMVSKLAEHALFQLRTVIYPM